jgi:hypothetical protein
MRTPIIILLVLVATGAFVVGGVALFSWISNMIFKSEPALLVIKTISADTEVTAITGTPIELRLLGGTISIKTGGSHGFADMDTTAYGPNGRLRFVAQVKKDSGEWSIQYLAIYPNDMKVIRVDHSAQPIH